MLYKNDWAKAREKYIEYWNKENHDRPLLALYAPRDNYTYKEIKAPDNLYDRWTDMEYIIKRCREGFAGTYYGGEAFPQLYPNVGPDIMGAMLGCELEFGESTSWSVHNIEDWEKVSDIKLDPQNKWYRKMLEMTQAAADDANGDYIVGITDLHPGLDAIVSLRGPENLCMDLYDYPEIIKKVNFQILDSFKTVVDDLHNIITKKQEGSTNWMGVWHPKKWYVTSCDFICMISEQMGREFAIPELTEESKWLDASIYHLDGPGALKHLDSLLDIPELNGIQWVPGAGQASATHWIPVLQKIQNAGKLIQMYVDPGEIEELCRHLKPEGVMLAAYCAREQDAKDIMKKVEQIYK